MARLELPSDKCLGFDIGGVSYDAHGSGYVEIDNPIHEQLIRADVGLRFHEQHHGYSRRVAGVECVCGFEGFAWQRGRNCPKCGRILEGEHAATQG